MDCVLCGNEIVDHHPQLNTFRIDEGTEVEVCNDCIHKFLLWQGERFSKLFPTRAAKRRYDKD
jgi:hypothetical protein